MPFLGVIVIGSVIGGVIAHGNYSDYRDHSNHRNYSDYRDHSNHRNYSDYYEKLEQQRATKQRDFDVTKQQLSQYINQEVERLENTYLSTKGLKKWDQNTANYDSYDEDFTTYSDEIRISIINDLKSRLERNIAEDNLMIKNINQIIRKINDIQFGIKNEKT